MSLAVVILAGGDGQRIGGGKPLKLFGGERLIDRAVRMAREWCDVVAIAVRDPLQVEPIDAPVIPDESGIPGPLAGLAAGLKFACGRQHRLLLTIPADMPFLPQDLSARLTSEIGDHHAALACSSGQLHPVCALWRTDIDADIAAYASEGRRSLRGLAHRVGFLAVEWPGDPHDPFFNVNFAEDLCEAERRLRQS